MKKNEIRVPTQVHTRELDRNIARKNMKEKGIVHINKPHFNKKTNENKSYFAENWRMYVNLNSNGNENGKRRRKQLAK